MLSLKKIKKHSPPVSGQALRIRIQGTVQGVGYRPFVYGLAEDLGLTGWIRNNSQGVELEVAGPEASLDNFLTRLHSQKPPHAAYENIEIEKFGIKDFSNFEILPSEAGEKTAVVLPDYATCSDCLLEIFDPHNRRYRYPFTNCTHCGPRFSILQALPYDRPNTTMAHFSLCPTCRQEYEDPKDRRFHAQPNACPDCGPQLALWDPQGKVLAKREKAMELAGEALRAGQVLALKGLGGFHLMVDGRNETAVQRLRKRKCRPHKPFATMFPNLKDLESLLEVSPLEASTLLAPEAPIVLLNQRLPSPLAPGIAPGLTWMGAMLPYTPLHHLLMEDLGFPVVATSGNRAEEPICIEEREALDRLAGIADVFLIHDRPIARPVDDSVVRVFQGELSVLRRSRGYAPLPLTHQQDSAPSLAVGGQLKNTVAINRGQRVFLSQHIGDLETLAARQTFMEVIERFEEFYGVRPQKIHCDLHPDYSSTQYAMDTGLPLHPVQHHHAHVLSLMAEHHLAGPVLGVAWDGTGYGSDGKLWGSEFLRATHHGFQRVAHWRYLPLPGGEKAIGEPRRVALGILFSMMGEKCFHLDQNPGLKNFSEGEWRLLQQILVKGLSSPQSCGMGRLFDAVAALLGVRQIQSFEGQAAMELESLAGQSYCHETYPLGLSQEVSGRVIDWEPMIKSILSDLKNNKRREDLAKKFHNTLAQNINRMAQEIGEEKVLLTGGCFQNKLLLELSLTELQKSGFQVYRHRKVPPNDGGIALGQIMAEDLCV